MGQYWMVVNLDKREYVCPHKVGAGLKLWEQLAAHPGTGAALVVLCAAMPEQRGGGDFNFDDTPEGYAAIAERTIGRWAGNRIALVGDYAERGDLPRDDDADLIYHLCGTATDRESSAAHWAKCDWTSNAKEQRKYKNKARRLRKAVPFTDVSDDVAAVLEHELYGKYTGDGWRSWTGTLEEPAIRPDLVLVGPPRRAKGAAEGA